MATVASPIEATLIPGDGIGPEITDAVLEALDAIDAPIAWDRQIAGVAAIERFGDPLPEATLASIRRTRLALKGPLTTPIGGPTARSTSLYAMRWSSTPTSGPPARSFQGAGSKASTWC